MSELSMSRDPFFDLLKQLAMAHGLPEPESADVIREFAFTPGGARYRLMPQPQDDTKALLEISITSLDLLLDDAREPQKVERLLRTLLQINAVWEEEVQWLVSLDLEDELILSTQLELESVSAEGVQISALQGLERSHAIRELCRGLI